MLGYDFQTFLIIILNKPAGRNLCSWDQPELSTVNQSHLTIQRFSILDTEIASHSPARHPREKARHVSTNCQSDP